MPLKITKADEVIEVRQICMTIYSQPGLGKTSIAFTADNPLLLDFDAGSYRAVDRGDVVQVSAWDDVASIRMEDLADYDTVVIDTVGKALDALAQNIIKGNPRLSYGGALNQQGWGQLGVRFGAFLRNLRGHGKDVILLAHMDEKADGEVIKERLKIPGGSKDVVVADSDVIARISIYNKQRQLVFSPTETSFGKDPARLGMMPVPDASNADYRTCLGDVVRKVKEGLNSLSEAQIARRSEVQWFEDTLPDLMGPHDINQLLGRAKKAGPDVAKMLVQRAKDLDLEYCNETGGYVSKEDAESGEREEGKAA